MTQDLQQLENDRIARLVEATVKVAVEAEREACALVIQNWPSWELWRADGAQAIRERGQA